MNTGEQPAVRDAAIGESTPVRLGLVIMLAGSLVAAGNAVYRVGVLEHDRDEDRTELRANAREIADLKTQVAIASSAVADLKDLARSMNAKLDRLLERGTTSANYHAPGVPR